MANITVSNDIDTFLQSANNAAAKSNLGIVQFYDTISNTEPVSPATGHRWFETTVNKGWYWTGSLWASLQLIGVPVDGAGGAAAAFNGVNATTNRFGQIPFPKALAVQFLSSSIILTADATNYWDITLGFGTQQSAAIVTSCGSFRLDSPVTRVGRNTTLSGISGSIDENCFYMIATRFGTPGTYTGGGSALIREVRL